jgi:hypothetical protein
MIEHFLWTFHAEKRLAEHWLVSGVCANGLRFVVAYDCPAYEDPGTARIVSIWTVDESRTRRYGQ